MILVYLRRESPVDAEEPQCAAARVPLADNDKLENTTAISKAAIAR